MKGTLRAGQQEEGLATSQGVSLSGATRCYLTVNVIRDTGELEGIIITSPQISGTHRQENYIISFFWYKDEKGEVKHFEPLVSSNGGTNVCDKWNIKYLSNAAEDGADSPNLFHAYRDEMYDKVYVCPHGIFSAGYKYSDGTDTFVSLGNVFFYKIT